MLSKLASRMPAQLKRSVKRTVILPAKHALDNWMLQHSIQLLRKNNTNPAVALKRLHQAWGNEDFSADLTYISVLATLVSNCRGNILECGTGITTIIAGVLAEKQNAFVYSLEQDASWADRVRQVLRDSSINRVQVSHAALHKYDGFVWYDVAEAELPKEYDLVVCDGPAVFKEWGDEAYSQWRYGLLRVLTERSSTVKVILLDDIDDARSAPILSRWEREFGITYRVIQSPDGDCAILNCQT